MEHPIRLELRHEVQLVNHYRIRGALLKIYNINKPD